MNFEKSIIFTFLNNPELILKSDIAPSDFSNITLAEALLVMRSLAVSGTKIDLIVVIDKMKSPDAMQVMRDVNLNATGVKENLKYYIKSIKELSLKKKLRDLLESTLNNLGNDSANSVVGDLTSRLSDLESRIDCYNRIQWENDNNNIDWGNVKNGAAKKDTSRKYW